MSRCQAEPSFTSLAVRRTTVVMLRQHSPAAASQKEPKVDAGTKLLES